MKGEILQFPNPAFHTFTRNLSSLSFSFPFKGFIFLPLEIEVFPVFNGKEG